jgi:hypothetical protein
MCLRHGNGFKFTCPGIQTLGGSEVNIREFAVYIISALILAGFIIAIGNIQQ